MTGLPLAFVLALALADQPADRHEHSTHFGETSTLTFDDALRLSLDTPAMRRRRDTLHDREVADRRVPLTTRNPEITIQPGARLFPDTDRGFAVQGQITQSWNLRRPGRARRQAMQAETRALSADVRREALSQRLHAARAWLELRVAEQELDLAREELDLAHDLVEQTRVAFEARLLTRSDLAEARQYAADVDTRVVQLEGRVHDLGLRLALEAGLPPDKPVATRGPTPEPTLPAGDVLVERFARVDALPQVTTARLEAVAAKARAAEARAQRGTQLTLGAATIHDGPGELIVQGVVGVSIPLFDRGQAEVARARTEAGLSEARAEQERRAVRHALAQALHELHHTRSLRARLMSEVLPTIHELVEARERGRSVGETTVFEVFAARRELLAARLALAEAEGELTWAEIVAWIYLAEIEHGEAQAR